MPLALKKYFTKKNIENNKFDASGALADQAVHCLELVAELVHEGLKFQFKGGNSLLLMREKPRRFSIDVDIATDEPRERIETCLDALVKNHGVFTKWTIRQHLTKPWLPLASYYCHYKSHYVKADDAFIMLDAQLDRSPYATHFVPIQCGGLYSSKIKAEIPFASSIIGDKLLTLGPNTLGIPLAKGKEAQRLKHVYDIAFLLGMSPSLHEIRTSFNACVVHENKLQEKSVTIEKLFSDTIAFCSSVKDFTDMPEIHKNMPVVLVEIVKGLGPFAGHLFSNDYEWKHLKIDMAKVALVMNAMCNTGVKDETFQEVLNKVEHFADTQFFWEKIGELTKKK